MGGTVVIAEESEGPIRFWHILMRGRKAGRVLGSDARSPGRFRGRWLRGKFQQVLVRGSFQMKFQEGSR